MEELSAEQQRIVGSISSEADREFAIEQFLKTNKIADGSYWTPLEELYEPTEEPYEGGYKNICLRMTHEWDRPINYKHIVSDLKDLVASDIKADEISVHSASTKNSDRSSGVGGGSNSSNNTPPKKSKDLVEVFLTTTLKRMRITPYCLGGASGNKCHIIPAPKSLCAPRYGIMAQPIIGYSFEDQVKEKIEECRRINGPTSDVDDLNKVLKKVLQKSIISDKKPQGLANTKENWLYVPKNGHEQHFDIGCQWFFVPVMTLEEALLGWKSGQPYKVMIIAGDLRQNDADYSAALCKTLIHHRVLDDKSACILTEPEIKMATTFLQDFVKALADMATGRGCGALTPEDLDREGIDDRYKSNGWQMKLAELQVGKRNLGKGTVLIPLLKVTDFSKVKVLGVTLKDGPDPCCLGIKNGMGFMAPKLPAAATGLQTTCQWRGFRV